MNPDMERLMRAYIEVYADFDRIFKKYEYDRFGTIEYEKVEEKIGLFQIAWKDIILGRFLKEAMWDIYKKLEEKEKQMQGAESEEAMVI